MLPPPTPAPAPIPAAESPLSPPAPFSAPPIAPSTLAERLSWGAERLGGKRALAAAAEISEAQLYRYLEGAVAIPHDKLVALAEAMTVDAGWLLTGWGDSALKTNRPRPEFRGALLQSVQEGLEMLLVEYQRSFSTSMKSQMVRYLYEVLRHEEANTGELVVLDKFKMLQYLSFLGEMQTEAELDVLLQAFDIMEYQGFTPNLKANHQLLTTWCNLLVRGMRGYYNSYAGQVYFDRMGQTLPPDAVAELHGLVGQAIQLTGKKDLDWLDAGCGNGRHLAHMHKFMPNIRIHGLELSDLGVELCHKLEKSERLPIGCVQQGDLRLAPYKSGSFDVVFAHLSLMEIPFLAETNIGFYEIIEELKRVLRPNGLLITTLPYGQGFNKKLPRQQFREEMLVSLEKNGWQLKKLTPPTHSNNLIRSNINVPTGLTYQTEKYIQTILLKS